MWRARPSSSARPRRPDTSCLGYLPQMMSPQWRHLRCGSEAPRGTLGRAAYGVIFLHEGQKALPDPRSVFLSRMRSTAGPKHSPIGCAQAVSSVGNRSRTRR